MFAKIFLREIKLYFQRGGEMLNMLGMFAMTSCFFVLAVPFDAPIGKVANGVVWVCSMLVLALAQHRILERDFHDGTLEQWPFMNIAEELIILAKILAYWGMIALPLLLLAPLISLMVGGGSDHLFSLVAALGLGSLAFIALGSIAAAGALRFGGRDLLTILLVMPLAIPILIFGSSASLSAFMVEGKISAEWLVLLAYNLVALPLACLVSVQLLRYARG